MRPSIATNIFENLEFGDVDAEDKLTLTHMTTPKSALIRMTNCCINKWQTTAEQYSQ